MTKQLAADLASFQPDVIKEAVFSILNEVTADEILILDREFRASSDKHGFLREFEATDHTPPKRSPLLLEKWTHYCWIRLELTYLIHQRASLNQIMASQQHIKGLLSESKDSLGFVMPSLDSVHRAILEGVERGMPIEESIQTLKQIKLQIVGTEHPTDQLSQEARDTVTRLASAIEEEVPDRDLIKSLLVHLGKVDVIPHVKRSVIEEVNRNIKITLDRLYDNVPELVHEIVDAYKTYYGEETYQRHEEDIIQALKGLLQDASWPGFDADGNDNINAESMRAAIRLYRIRAAEKHTTALTAQVMGTAKTIERQLRDQLFNLKKDVMHRVLLAEIPIDRSILLRISDDLTDANGFISNRNYDALVACYVNLKQYLSRVDLGHLQAELMSIINTQDDIAKKLVRLTQFSGYYYKEGQACYGDLQTFQKIFSDYKEAIRDNTDAIMINNIPASNHVLDCYDKIVKKYDDLLRENPQLLWQVRYFGIQLHSFGMTYGKGHIRQNSPVYSHVWNSLFSDLHHDPVFSSYDFFNVLKGREYKDLTEAERIELHKRLHNESAESKAILNAIRHKHRHHEYLSEAKYDGNPSFVRVATELQRMELALFHADMFENVIIANCQQASNILEVESLMSLFPHSLSNANLTIVPLLETRQDLDNYENILIDYIKTRIQRTLEKAFDTEERSTLQAILQIQSLDEIKPWVESKDRESFRLILENHPLLKPVLSKIVIETMIGFSDTERAAGLSALIAVQKGEEDILRLAHDFGVTPKIYHGPGGDPNRGGLKRRDEKATLQGNARSNVLNTATSTQWYRENQFYHAYTKRSQPLTRMNISNLSEEMQAWLMTCMEEGATLYEHLHDTEHGLGQLMGYLLGQGAHWLVSLWNASSRASQRDVKDKTRPDAYIHPDKPRAITAAQMKEVLRDNIDFIGTCYGIRSIGAERASWLYDQSEVFRDMMLKIMMGSAKRDLSFLAHALFGEQKEWLPQNEEERKAWAKQCKEEFPKQLETIDIEAMSKNPKDKEKLSWMLSRFFAYITDELEQDEAFLFQFNQSMHPMPKGKKEQHPADLLARFPLWEEQTKTAIDEEEPLNYLLARLTHHVTQAKSLDEIYPGLNTRRSPHSKLNGLMRLLGNVSGIIAARIMPPSFYENFFLDIRENNERPGFARAQQEAEGIRSHIDRLRPPKPTVWRFFGSQKAMDDFEKELIPLLQTKRS